MTRILFFALLSLLCFACEDDDDGNLFIDDVYCGQAIEVTDPVGVPAGDRFDFVSASVDWPCLAVVMANSGCSTDLWTGKLVTSGEVAESAPTQTSARFVFDDGTPGGVSCLAYFTDTFRFDLRAYLLPGSLPTLLSVSGPDSTLVTLLIE